MEKGLLTPRGVESHGLRMFYTSRGGTCLFVPSGSLCVETREAHKAPNTVSQVIYAL